jgi:copper(I)-binding protein
MFQRALFTFLATMCVATASHAHSYQVGDLKIRHPFARATVEGQPVGAAYLVIENNGKMADRLIGVSTPVAKSAEMHTMSTEGGVMRMRKTKEIRLEPGSVVSMKPGDGYHLMLFGLTGPLKKGETIPLTLTFEKAGKTEISVDVQDAAATPAATGKSHGDSHHGHGGGHVKH